MDTYREKATYNLMLKRKGKIKGLCREYKRTTKVMSLWQSYNQSEVLKSDEYRNDTIYREPRFSTNRYDTHRNNDLHFPHSSSFLFLTSMCNHAIVFRVSSAESVSQRNIRNRCLKNPNIPNLNGA